MLKRRKLVCCVANNKLAPIFDKRSSKQQSQSGKKSPPILTEAEKQALEVRRAFLTSGVPDELKRQKASVVIPATDVYPSVVWPTDSHIQQRPAAPLNAGYCDPWTLQSCDLPCRQFTTRHTSLSAELSLGLFTDLLEKGVSDNDKVCAIHCFTL